MRHADERAPKSATIGVHLDNVHNLDAAGIARLINDYLQAIEAAKQQGLIARTRTVGYVAKNNPEVFKQALDQRLLRTVPLYQIVENAHLDQKGALDENSRAAQELGRRYAVPVFLKTFGTDVAYTTEQGGTRKDVLVTQDMTRQMARMANISGAAWSPDEQRYQPTLFVQGSPVRQMSKNCDKVASAEESFAPATRELMAASEPPARATKPRPRHQRPVLGNVSARAGSAVQASPQDSLWSMRDFLSETRTYLSPVRKQKLARSRT